ncbi:ATP-binding protein [Dactylosporangium darangshiense]|uniref:sensor histidine kinase n=1 Tax=Dactylosporangium darangshiense TaxID=579108 RepID=UPI0031F1A6FB
MSIPAVSALASIQQERRLTVAYLSQPSKDMRELLEQRQQTDQRLSELRIVADAGLANAPQSIMTRWKTVTEYLDRLPGARRTIDAKSAGVQYAHDFFNGLLDAATALFDAQARMVPDATGTQEGIAATDVWRAGDLMSRAGSTIEAAFRARALGDEDYLAFVSQVGTYHFVLTNVAPHLQPNVRQRYERIMASDSWKQLVGAEDSVIANGAWRNGVPRGLPVDVARWQAVTGQVSDELINLTIMEADQVSAQTLHTGNNQLLTASLGSLIALFIAIAAIVWAVRSSRVLVDQALAVRLTRLGEDAATIVDQRLPAMMDRLRQGEPVDLAVELPPRDYGSDEIGQVAAVINRSLHAAAGAAADEARARAAGLAMLMGVARRPQRPLQHGLKVIKELERSSDEKLLPQLFDVNHQFTQIRRFLENLVILAGGQIGRRFNNPVPLRRVLLSAISETRDYKRISLRNAPDDVALVGSTITATIHLLAELLDNALVFSNPETTVWVTCIEIHHGVAVEIEDAGLGMAPEAVDRVNEFLATARPPDIKELKDGAQVGLFVVAELARREGIQVSLRRSAYGGLSAVVLVPDHLIAAESPEPDSTLAVASSHHSRTAAAVSRHGTARRHDPRHAATAVVTAANGSVSTRGDTRAERGRQSDFASSMMSDTPPNGKPDASEGPESTVTHAVSTDSAGTRPATRPDLPRRQPQQHIMPALRDDSLPGENSNTGAPSSGISPEEARDRYSRYQQARTTDHAATNDTTHTRADQGRIA